MTASARLVRWSVVAAILCVPLPAAAQIDLSGLWGVRYHEDYWHRQAGPEIGDYTGLPINDVARFKAQSWEEAVLAEPERQCIPHVVTYAMRGPANIRISKVIDALSGREVAYRVEGLYGRADRNIWLDGRPHPPQEAKHTYSGFSTGVWEGNKLKVTTTHVKWGWIQRNGVPLSDQVTMTEYFMRHDTNVLTVVSILEDPVYLEAPLVRSTDWLLDLNMRVPAPFRCGPDQITVEAQGFDRHHVPHHLPGRNEQMGEFARSRNLPMEAAAGGLATLYPEYIATIRAFQADIAVRRSTALKAGADPFLGTWLLHRGKSTFNGLDISVRNANGGVVRSGALPAKRLARYEPAGSGGIRHITDTQPLANDTGYNRVEYTAQFDGKDYPIRGSNLETVSLRRVNERTIERTGKIGGKVVETATALVSADGLTLTITTNGTFEGKPYSNIQIFERQ